MRFLVCTALLLYLTGCSLYESDGRKFLETSSYTFAGVAAQSTCSQESPQDKGNRQWVELSNTDDARVLAHENDSYELRVIPSHQTGAKEFGCTYPFATAQDLYRMTPDAVRLTIQKYSEKYSEKHSQEYSQEYSEKCRDVE